MLWSGDHLYDHVPETLEMLRSKGKSRSMAALGGESRGSFTFQASSLSSSPTTAPRAAQTTSRSLTSSAFQPKWYGRLYLDCSNAHEKAKCLHSTA